MKLKYLYKVSFVILIIIFVYVIFNFYRLFGRENIKIYEVQVGEIVNKNEHNGSVIKDYEDFHCTENGYITYYVKNFDKVYRNQVVYTISKKKSTDENDIIEYGYAKSAGIVTIKNFSFVTANSLVYSILKNPKISFIFNSDYDYDKESGKNFEVNILNDNFVINGEVASFTDELGEKKYRLTTLDFPEKFIDKNDVQFEIIRKKVKGIKIPLTSIVEKTKIVDGEAKVVEGVYDMNKGYAIFKNIEIIDKDDEYAIIKSNTYNGITIYDHIALNAGNVEDGDML